MDETGKCGTVHIISVRSERTELIWVKKRGGGHHLGLYCRECGGWIAWLPQTAYNRQYAPPEPIE